MNAVLLPEDKDLALKKALEAWAFDRAALWNSNTLVDEIRAYVRTACQ